MLNARQEYVNVISRHQVIQKDKNGKAWMIMGVVDIAPDQTPMERIRRTGINRKTGEILPTAVVPGCLKHFIMQRLTLIYRLR